MWKCSHEEYTDKNIHMDIKPIIEVNFSKSKSFALTQVLPIARILVFFSSVKED
jgi:hypothetical protein